VWCIAACALAPIVVIVAIGVLAAPYLRRAREAGREYTRYQGCIDNAKQMAQGAQMYAQDYDDHLPAATAWMDAEAPYVDRSGTKDRPAFRCPTVANADPKAYGYAFNSQYGGKPLAKISAPATAGIVYDSTNLARNATDAVKSLPSPGRHLARARRFRSVHVDVMGYADGHVKPVTDKGQTAQLSSGGSRNSSAGSNSGQ
jgi:hypothetical protein